MIILFGMAGTGKGTQGKILADLYGWRWISVGEVIRNSHKYTETINHGDLIPDVDVNKMMHEEIKETLAKGKDVILDGYPRDEAQAQYVVENYGDQIQLAIVLDVPKEELYERLALRGRDDDKERESIDKRFEVFEQNIYSILSLLKTKKVPVQWVNGVGQIEEVTDRLRKVVQETLGMSEAPGTLTAEANEKEERENQDD